MCKFYAELMEKDAVVGCKEFNNEYFSFDYTNLNLSNSFYPPFRHLAVTPSPPGGQAILGSTLEGELANA